MTIDLKIGRRGEFTTIELIRMHHLRTAIFKDLKGWDVHIEHGLEVDEYDHDHAIYMVMSESGIICGCWRILPTTGSYMLRNTFSQLLHGAAPPEEHETYELSRFAITNTDHVGPRLSALSILAMRAIVDFGNKQGIKQYVTVTTTAMERLLTERGIEVRRFGPPIQIGKEQAVALEIDIGSTTRQALL